MIQSVVSPEEKVVDPTVPVTHHLRLTAFQLFVEDFH